MKREKITRVRGGDKTPRRNSATATMRSGGGEGRSLSPSTRSTAQGIGFFAKQKWPIEIPSPTLFIHCQQSLMKRLN